jgi:hypothetical protein
MDGQGDGGLTAALGRRLRGAFEAAGYTVEGVAERLGAQANNALARNETTPAYRATTSGDPLDLLIRLFLLQRAVPESLLSKAFPATARELLALGIIVGSRI